VLLDLMVKFDTVCRENDIKYSIDSGTLLGAVRHKGFIPWDNDADVIMLRSEYDRLCKIGPKVFKEPYFWQTNETDPGTLRRHAQLRNSLTTCLLNDEMENGQPRFDFNQGVFLDVFVLDEVPDDTDELKTFRDDLQYYLPLLWDFKEYYRGSGKAEWMKKAQQQAFEEFETVVTRYNGTGQKRVGNMSLLPMRKESTLFARELFTDLVEYPFEGFSFYGPRDYETVLKGFYGDWQKLVIGEDAHGSVFLDLERSYIYYLKDFPVQKKESEEHPILKLYKQRNELIKQRDEAWVHIDSLRRAYENKERDFGCATNRIGQLDKKYKKLKRNILVISSVVIFVLAILFIWKSMII